MGSADMSEKPQTTRAVCVSMWLGEKLGPLSAACLSSFVRHGHRVVLYCYDPLDDVPPGVEVADGNAIVPSSKIVRYRESGSFALCADLFRYELQRRDLGLWIDCDVYCLRPFDFATEMVVGWRGSWGVNNAVMRLPKDSPILEELIGLFSRDSPVLPWLTKSEQNDFRTRKLSGEKFDLSDLPWGSAGPHALTYLLRERGLLRQALPSPVFYPLLAKDVPVLLRANANILQFIRPETRAVHLFNEKLRKSAAKAERDSPIDRFDETRLSLAG